MRRFMTVIAIGTVLVTVSAYGAAMMRASFVWDGSSSAFWDVPANWTANSSYPGELTANNTDDATIANTTNSNPVVVNSTIQYDVDFVVVNADAADADVTLQIDSNGDLDVLNSGDGYIRLIAGMNAEDPPTPVDAKLAMVAGEPDPVLRVDDLDLDGGVHSSTFNDRGLAVVDFDAAPTITDDVDATGDVEFGGDASFTISDALNIGDGAIPTEFRKLGTGTVTVTGLLYVHADQGEADDAKLLHSAGTLATSDLKFDGAPSDGTDYGDAIGEFNSTVTVSDDVDAIGDVSFGGSSSFDIGTGAGNDLRIGDGLKATDFHKTGSGTVTVKGSIIITGGNDAGENTTVTVDDGTLQTGC